MKSYVPNVPLSTNVTLPVRLRRAIHLNDLVLVKRIAKKRPDRLQNPDFADNGNTSLHLAAQLGFLEIAVMLSARTAPSFPGNSTSPSAQQSPPRFRSTAPSPQLLVSTLIQYSPLPASVLLSAADHDGNTALHYASAYGQLKAIRALLAAGANPGARNAYSWTPVAYSSTVQAEVYFRGLIGAGGENGLGGGAVKREAEGGGGGGLSRGGVGGAGLRIVRTREELGSGMDMRFGDGRRRAGSAD
ncbi:MAG: hypothetical protein Q9185_003684 [Variospora sp. 1 TL-2023]